jgi:hypothetical protein
MGRRARSAPVHEQPVARPPERPPWDVRTKSRMERIAERARRRRVFLTVLCVVLLAVALLVAVPTLIRNHDVDRWERCVEQRTGSTLGSRPVVSRTVVEACGPIPRSKRLPADRRN